MLKDFSSIWDYREFISSHKSNLSESERKRLDSIKSVARNPIDSSMEGIATIFNKAI